MIGIGKTLNTCLIALAFLTIGLRALAHQPYCEFADLTAAAPWRVPDASISYAFFGNVYPVGDIDYFSFRAEAGQSVLLSASIPAIPDLEVFAPMMVVFGPGIDAEPPVQLPFHLVKPDDANALLIPLGDEPTYFYEPFGRVYFWNWDDYFFRAPQTATYTVALWHPGNEIGRYTFVIGQREVFGGEADCFASFHDYWIPLEAGVNPYRDSLMTDDMMNMMNAVIDMDAEAAPTVDLQVIPLADGSFNLRVVTDNFVFTPQLVDMAGVPGEGHAHLYVDGAKVARIYGEWYHLPALPEDAETVSVTLYANDHRAFAVDGKTVSASVTASNLQYVQES